MPTTQLLASDRFRPVMRQNDIFAEIKKVVVILIKPTHYDDDGYPYEFWKDILPSNTLSVLNALTRQALEDVIPKTVQTEIHMLRDGVRYEKKLIRRLHKRFPEHGTKLIVGLVGVQTAQFPRACDIMYHWKEVGATCVIGGFHVSGLISTLVDGIKDNQRPDVPCPGQMPEDLQKIMDDGIVIFHGEAEDVWRQTLYDIVCGKQESLYRGGMPDITHAPLAEYTPIYIRGSVTNVIAIDTCRGCVFHCSFCCIINVQGRTVRARAIEPIISLIKKTCEDDGLADIFFVDDDHARNPYWKELALALAVLRRKGYRIRINCEADLAIDKIPDFPELMAAAGCTQMFTGVESPNLANLSEASKKQNHPERFKTLFDRFHAVGMTVHAGCIIGFSHDTPQSVLEDVDTIVGFGIDQASYFILSPAPGSEDYARAIAAGVEMDMDWNRFDTFHPVVDHPSMTREEWLQAYHAAWYRFYATGNMVQALKRCKSRSERIELLKKYIHYWWSFDAENTHPMIAGFHRIRDFWDRRPSAAPLSYVQHLWQQCKRNLRYVRKTLAQFYRFQHVIFEVECAPALAGKRSELSDRLHGFTDWLRKTFGRAMSRRWLNRYWRAYGMNKWRLLYKPWLHAKLVPLVTTEVVFTVRFAAILPRLLMLK